MSLTKVGVVLGLGASGTWDAGLVEGPHVFLDQSGQYAMVYVGYDGPSEVAQIGLAWSTDKVTWTKVADPILGPSGSGPDAAGCTGPFVFFESGTYYLFYIGLPTAGYEQGTKTTCVATATSLTGPWTRLGTIIAPSLAAAWRNNAIWHPHVVKVGDTYYDFFNAGGLTEAIGYATASSLLGPWTVDDANSPLVSKAATGWDAGWVGDPFLFQTNTAWFMAYYGVAASAPLAGSDGYTWTDVFPLSWRRGEANPVLSPGIAGSFDATHAHKPSILVDGSTLYHYYTAVGVGGRRIALATDTIPIAPIGGAAPTASARRSTPTATAVRV